MKKVKCIWLGPTGSTPGIGFTITNKEISVVSETFEHLKAKGLVKELKPETKSNSKKVKE